MRRIRAFVLLQHLEEELRASLLRLFRLHLLLITVAVIGFVVYWLMQDHIEPRIAEIWDELSHQVEIFSFSGAIKAIGIWVKKMGIHYVTKEIPKRIGLAFLLSYGLLWLMPLKQRIGLRDFLKQALKRWVGRIITINLWLRRDDVFGPLAGWAIGLIVTLVLLLLSTLLAGIWIIIALGFVKLPATASLWFRSLMRWLSFLLQKLPFGKGVKVLTTTIWTFVVRWLGKFSIWKPKSEEKRRKERIRQIGLIRKVIYQRFKREAAWQTFWRAIRSGQYGLAALAVERQEQARVIEERHTYWHTVLFCKKRGIPSVTQVTKIPKGRYLCCQHYVQHAGVPILRESVRVCCEPAPAESDPLTPDMTPDLARAG